MDKNKLERLAHVALMDSIAAQGAKERAEESKAALVYALEQEDMLNPDTRAIGDARLRISANRAFDVNKGVAFLSKKDAKECMVSKLDPAKVKDHLTPIQLEQAMVTHANPWKIGIAVLEDD